MGIKPKKGDKGNLFSPTDDKWVTSFDYPIFCFKYLHSDYNLDKCDDAEKIDFLERITKLSTLTWIEIQKAPRHGFGSEKITIDSIRPSLPPFVTPDVDFLLSLRFSGMKPMVGHRNKFIFHVLYLDTKYEVYKH